MKQVFFQALGFGLAAVSTAMLAYRTYNTPRVERILPIAYIIVAVLCIVAGIFHSVMPRAEKALKWMNFTLFLFFSVALLLGVIFDR